MAIKDWKKTKTFHKEIFNWENTLGEILQVARFPDGWMVWKPNSRPSVPLKDKITTKSQALKFAKEYMRKH